jgi:hypothetical protein
MPYAFNPFTGLLQPQVPSLAAPATVPGAIGTAGTKNFGVGPIVPVGATFYPLFDELYFPVHLPSGSFM